MRELEPPIFCNHCPLLALALLDGEPVCAECLAAEVAHEGVEALCVRVEPLRLKKPFWWRKWCHAGVVGARASEPRLKRAG